MSAYGSINMDHSSLVIKAVRVCQRRIWQHQRLLMDVDIGPACRKYIL